MMTKKDFERIAAGLRYVAQDPAAHRGTVEKMVNEFCSAAKATNPRFNEAQFRRAIFGKEQP